jgi:hypothetical protein
MSKISLEGNVSGSGTLTIAAPNTNSNFTLTLPTETGTIITNSGNQAGAFTTLNTSGAVVFNDAGADVDFRVEGDTDANLLFVDAGNDRVGIGTSSPGQKLDVAGRIHVTGATVASGFSNSTFKIAGSQSVADDATVSAEVVNASLVYVAENNAGTGVLFFATYASATVVIVADPSGIGAVSDTDGKLCAFKSAATTTITIKNRLGATKGITVGMYSVSD